MSGGYVDIYGDLYLGDPSTGPNLTYYPGIPSPVVMPITDFFGFLSSAVNSTWNATTRVSSTVTTNWNTNRQRVSTTAAMQWNDYFRVEKNNEAAGFSQGILQPVVHPIDWYYNPAGCRWNVDQRRGSTQRTTWNDIQRRSSLKKITFNTTISVHATKSTAWRVLQRVYVPGNNGVNFYVGINQPTVHPIDYGFNLVVPAITWNIAGRINKTALLRFNVDVSRVSRKIVNWNTLDTHVTTQAPVTWFTLQKVLVDGTGTWKTNDRISAQKKTRWNDYNSVVSQKAFVWKVPKDRISVIKALTTEYSLPTVVVHPISYYQSVIPEFQWNDEKRITVKAKSLFNINTIVDPQLRSTWKVLLRMRVPDYGQIYYPQVMQPTTHPITKKTYPWIARSTWNFSDLVIKQQASSFNTLNKVVKTAALRWNTVGRPNMQEASRFNTRISVVSQVVVKWNTGIMYQPFIRQVAVVREDFAY